MSDILGIDELINVIQHLEDARFDKTKWKKLGGTLGLHINTLNMINKNESGDIEDCFRECLGEWLKRVDNVDKVGKPSLDTLADALDKMNGCKDQAEYIRKLAQKGDTGKTGEKNAKSMGPKMDSTKKNNKEGGAQASAGDEDIDEPDAPKGPQVPEKQDFHEGLVKDIEILLMPATTSEEGPVVHYLKQSPEELIETEIDGLRVYIGYYGKSKVIVVMTAPSKSRQGPIHAALITFKMLEKFPSIKYVVAVGVCFGMYPGKQNLGDVVISDMICDFTNKREGEDEDNEYQRGAHHLVKPAILHKFRPHPNFEMPGNIKVLPPGVLISTGSLIDNPEVKQKLLESRKDAIAGEMEGAGIINAIDYIPGCVAEAIVIKGIGDWGDGNKEAAKGSKANAAHNAAQYVYAALNNWKLQ